METAIIPRTSLERDRYGGRRCSRLGRHHACSRADLHIFDAEALWVCRFLFMDDNAPCHRTVAAEQLLESEDIERMDWNRQDLQISTPSSMYGIFLGGRLAARTLTTSNDSGASIGAARTNGQQCLNNSLTPSFSAWADV
ncbi:hypothetical protein TNCV_4130201 [Trichonephila clavipes]|nr:hypothetical protein TNCV_4130201 [Trichonephila clavipes]